MSKKTGAVSPRVKQHVTVIINGILCAFDAKSLTWLELSYFKFLLFTPFNWGARRVRQIFKNLVENKTNFEK